MGIQVLCVGVPCRCFAAVGFECATIRCGTVRRPSPTTYTTHIRATMFQTDKPMYATCYRSEWGTYMFQTDQPLYATCRIIQTQSVAIVAPAISNNDASYACVRKLFFVPGLLQMRVLEQTGTCWILTPCALVSRLCLLFEFHTCAGFDTRCV